MPFLFRVRDFLDSGAFW